jgi:hypothetical protein
MDPEHVTFGPFHLDRRQRIVRRDGIATKLGQRACDVLNCAMLSEVGLPSLASEDSNRVLSGLRAAGWNGWMCWEANGRLRPLARDVSSSEALLKIALIRSIAATVCGASRISSGVGSQDDRGGGGTLHSTIEPRAGRWPRQASSVVGDARSVELRTFDIHLHAPDFVLHPFGDVHIAVMEGDVAGE